MKKYIHLCSGLLCLYVLTSCNIYSAMTGNRSDEDHIESGEACLRDGDYDCAKENFLAITVTATKNERLCAMSLSRAGLSLPALLGVVVDSSKGSQMLGALANKLVPWSAERDAASVDAQDVYCKALREDPATSSTQRSLFGTLSAFVRCATLMAKTDQLVASSNDDTVCTTKGNQDGTITKADITDNTTTGVIIATGMCQTDVLACTAAIETMAGSTLSGVAGISSAFSNVPDSLKSSATGAALARKTLADTI